MRNRSHSIQAIAAALLLLMLVACGRDDRVATVTADSETAAAEARKLLATVDHADGKALYAGCQACHGTDAAGVRAMNAPSLLHQQPWYLKRQMLAFRSGQRGAHPKDTLGAQMAAIAITLPDEAAIDAVISYIGSLRGKKPGATLEGNIRRGEDYYSNTCGACHGPAAEGNAALDSPALAGVDDWYLLRQFENYRRGIRGYHEEDRFGRQMVMMAPALPDEAVARDVMVYVQSLVE